MSKRKKRVVTIEPSYYPEVGQDGNAIVLVEMRRGVRHEVRIKFNQADCEWLAEGIATRAIEIIRLAKERKLSEYQSVKDRLARVSEEAAK